MKTNLLKGLNMLSKEQILKADDLPIETVEVPEWGGSVLVRTMTGTERDAFETSLIDGKERNLTNIRAKLCSKCMVDQSGERLFADSDITALGKKSASALDRVFSAAQRLNGISADDVKELEKNSGAIPADSSISD